MKVGETSIIYEVDGIRKKCLFHEPHENEDMWISFDIIKNESETRVDINIYPKTKIILLQVKAAIDVELRNEDLIFLNGFQTWTNSREFNLREKIPRLHKIAWPILSVYGDYDFYNSEKNRLHSHVYTYIRKTEKIAFIGSLSEKSGYTIFDYDCELLQVFVFKDCKGLELTNFFEAFSLFFTEGEENDCFDRYFNKMNIGKTKAKQCTGWTSWYNYYTKISEEIVLKNLKAFQKNSYPIEIFQIDDGYQQQLGDWLCINDKFPRGMKFIADEIKGAGYKAGLWLAPFVCDWKSNIYREHPEWVLNKAGFNPGWNGFFKVLDFYNEEFRSYLRKVFNTIFNDWGFDMVKLDFLYAVALGTRKDKTRGTIMYEAMQFLREISGDKLILGCGVPLGSAFGLVDFCRIGADVSLTWEDKLLKKLNYRERVSTINSLESTIGRWHLNNRAFLNDPDVFIVRKGNNKLNKVQRYTLLLMNLILGGLVFMSDNPDEYDEDEAKLYKTIFPIVEKRIHKLSYNNLVEIHFSIRENRYLAFSNLKGQKQMKVRISEGRWYSRETGTVVCGEEIMLEPYQSICFISTDMLNEEMLKSENLFWIQEEKG